MAAISRNNNETIAATSTPVSKRQRSFIHHDRTLSNSQLDDSLLLPNNNDIREKKKLHEKRVRKSMHLNIVKEGAKSREPVESALSKLSEKEQVEHYQLCLKLSSENKISTKNAFGLHLIEYFSDIVKKDKDAPNFQAASIALQASTKIYSVRVDTLYSEATKVIGGLSTKNKQQAENNFNSDDVIGDVEIDENRVPEKDQRKTKSKGKHKRFILDDCGAINTISFGGKEMPYEKYNILASTFEEGDLHGLLYQLTPSDDCCCIQLTQPYFCAKQTSSFPQHEMSELIAGLDLFETISVISPTVDQFSFFSIKWPLDDNVSLEKCVQNLPVLDAFDNLILESRNDEPFQYSASQQDVTNELITANENSMGYDLEGPQDDFDVGIDNDQDLPTEPLAPESTENKDIVNMKDNNHSVVTQDGTPSCYLPPSPPKSKISLNDITQCLVNVSTEYVALDPKLELQILGHNILKARQKQSKPKLIDTRAVTVSSKESAYLSFDDSDSIDLKNKFISSKKNCLTNVTLKRWVQNSSNNLLPSWTINENKMRALFTKPSVVMDVKQKDLKLFDVHNEALDYNEHESIDDFGGGGGDDFFHQSNTSLPNVHSPISLIDAKNKRVKDVISFDKIAKKIDQKFVKSVLWSVLKQMSQPVSLDNEKRPNTTLPFGNIYKHLQVQLPDKMKKDISVHVAFAILLHLANEHNLFLKSSSDLKNVAITCST